MKFESLLALVGDQFQFETGLLIIGDVDPANVPLTHTCTPILPKVCFFDKFILSLWKFALVQYPLRDDKLSFQT